MSENMEQLRVITGRVVSDRMDKTASVLVERVIKHPVYGKYVKKSTKLLAHDEKNQCKEGDLVSIVSCRPISKRKSFKVVEIVESASI
jgi:small subunit ribosomal protein S17